MFQLSCKNTSGSLGERELLWEYEQQASISTNFLSSPKLSWVRYKSTEKCFPFLLENTVRKKKENHSFTSISLCSHQVFLSSYRSTAFTMRFLTRCCLINICTYDELKISMCDSCWELRPNQLSPDRIVCLVICLFVFLHKEPWASSSLHNMQNEMSNRKVDKW